jgi:hypothetical protein
MLVWKDGYHNSEITVVFMLLRRKTTILVSSLWIGSEWDSGLTDFVIPGN